jgi:hypothetical protein
MLTKAECSILTSFDPLSTNNFKLPMQTCLGFEQQEVNATKMYQRRLIYQLDRLPEHMFRLRGHLQQKLDNINRKF